VVRACGPGRGKREGGGQQQQKKRHQHWIYREEEATFLSPQQQGPRTINGAITETPLAESVAANSRVFVPAHWIFFEPCTATRERLALRWAVGGHSTRLAPLHPQAAVVGIMVAQEPVAAVVLRMVAAAAVVVVGLVEVVAVVVVVAAAVAVAVAVAVVAVVAALEVDEAAVAAPFLEEVGGVASQGTGPRVGGTGRLEAQGARGPGPVIMMVVLVGMRRERRAGPERVTRRG
jgi:hypothetical protein